MKKHGLWIWLLVAVAVTVFVHRCSDKKPCTVPPVPSYLYDLDSYRNHRIQDEVDGVNGDRFDDEAARKRILSIPDDKLDAERQADLAFSVKVYNEAQEHCR